MAEPIVATGFPTIALDELKPSLATIPGIETVLLRPLNQTDPNASLGIWGSLWEPVDQEIGIMEPSISRYPITAQALIKHTDEAEGRAQHTEIAKRIRRMLYRDNDLAVRLRGLRDQDGPFTERTLRWLVLEQRFAANTLDGDFWYLSTTECVIETETV